MGHIMQTCFTPSVPQHRGSLVCAHFAHVWAWSMPDRVHAVCCVAVLCYAVLKLHCECISCLDLVSTYRFITKHTYVLQGRCCGCRAQRQASGCGWRKETAAESGGRRGGQGAIHRKPMMLYSVSVIHSAHAGLIGDSISDLGSSKYFQNTLAGTNTSSSTDKTSFLGYVPHCTRGPTFAHSHGGQPTTLHSSALS